MSAVYIYNFYLWFGNSPLAAARLALSFAEGPSYNGFVLVVARGKLPLPMQLSQGVGGWEKGLLVLDSESIVIMRRRVPEGHLLYALFLPFLSNYLDVIPLPSAFIGCSRPASTRSWHYLSPQPNYFSGSTTRSHNIRTCPTREMIGRLKGAVAPPTGGPRQRTPVFSTASFCHVWES